MPDNSARRDRLQVGAFFGFVAGVLALTIALLWTWLGHPAALPLRAAIRLHGLGILVYSLAGALLGGLWPLRRRRSGRWLLWFIATATGAATVASLAYGAPWHWSRRQVGMYALMAVLFTPVFASSTRTPPGSR